MTSGEIQKHLEEGRFYYGKPKAPLMLKVIRITHFAADQTFKLRVKTVYMDMIAPVEKSLSLTLSAGWHHRAAFKDLQGFSR